MYVTQLIDEHYRMKTWKQLAGRSSKGQIPGWFKY